MPLALHQEAHHPASLDRSRIHLGPGGAGRSKAQRKPFGWAFCWAPAQLDGAGGPELRLSACVQAASVQTLGAVAWHKERSSPDTNLNQSTSLPAAPVWRLAYSTRRLDRPVLLLCLLCTESREMFSQVRFWTAGPRDMADIKSPHVPFGKRRACYSCPFSCTSLAPGGNSFIRCKLPQTGARAGYNSVFGSDARPQAGPLLGASS